MVEEPISLAELKNKAMNFDRADMRDLEIVKDQERIPERNYMAVWNIDKHQRACIAPKSYSVIQHRYATEVIIDALSSLNIKAEAMLKNSKHGIHIDFNFPEAEFELTEVGEKFTSGIRLVNDYALQGLVISPRITRLACANGMIVTDIVKSQRIKYTEQLTITIEGTIDKIIKDIITNDNKLADMVSICMKDSIEWQAAKLLVRALFKRKKHVKEILARMKFNKDNTTNRWLFYNAITEFATKGTRLKPAIEAALQNKAQDVLKTPFNELTEQLIKVEEK